MFCCNVFKASLNRLAKRFVSEHKKKIYSSPNTFTFCLLSQMKFNRSRVKCFIFLGTLLPIFIYLFGCLSDLKAEKIYIQQGKLNLDIKLWKTSINLKTTENFISCVSGSIGVSFIFSHKRCRFVLKKLGKAEKISRKTKMAAEWPWNIQSHVVVLFSKFLQVKYYKCMSVD